MTRWTAVTKENIVGIVPYQFVGSRIVDIDVTERAAIRGFQGTHQPAVAMGESGQVLLCPGVGLVKPEFDDPDRLMRFSHGDETSSPHYYSVKLETTSGSEIFAEMTATSRASSLRFTFDGIASPYVVVQATRLGVYGMVDIDVEQREIYGWNPERQASMQL